MAMASMDMTSDVAALAPVLVLLLGAVLTLVVGIFLPRRLQTANAAAAGVVLLAAAGLAAARLADPPGLVFDATFALDRPLLTTLLVLAGTGLLVAALSVPLFRGDAREAEYYSLLLFALLGAVLLAGAHDLMEILLGVLLASVPAYALVAWRRTGAPAMEALLKYYLFGALLNVGLIYGLVLLYGLSGETLLTQLAGAAAPGARPLAVVALVLVVVGLGFKAGYVPGHFWIPDVYQGTTVPVAAFLSVVPKVAAVLVLSRLVTALPAERLDLSPLVAGVAAVTMTWGNLAAFPQNDIRRLLGYSTIAQTGYLLLAVVAAPVSPLALPALVFYFAAYAAANVGAFAVVAATRRFELSENRGLISARPLLAVSMLVALLSLTGIPPTAGFVGKLAVFAAAFDAGYAWLVVVALVNSALSLYYYLRVLAPMFVPRPPADVGRAVEPWAAAVAVVCAVLTVGLGVAAFVLFPLPGAGSL
jgi:NADH-quinone oxidoreductase subunit N